MELRHLKSFAILADELHFRRAAERLFISQPALSRQMQHLEDELGVQLIDRGGREVQLTAAGAAFLREAQATLRQAEQAGRTAQRVARGEEGTLVVGFAGPAIYGVLSDIVRTYRDRYPDVTLVLREMQTKEQFEALQQGTLDVGVHEADVRCAALPTEIIEADELVLALPPMHPLAGVPSFELSALAEEPMVLFDRAFEPKVHDALMSLCQQHGFSPIVAQQAERLPIILGLVRAGLGWAFATTTIRDGLGGCGVVYKPVLPTPPPLQRRLTWTNAANPIRDRFLDIAREVVQQTTQHGEVAVG